MNDVLDNINCLISSIFYDIVKLEEDFLKNSKFKNLSHKELKTIEAIHLLTSSNMSLIAKKLDVTLGTLTVAITNLEKKGYVRRQKSTEDKRIVNVLLMAKSKKLIILYSSFKKDIIKNSIIHLSNTEKEVFSGTLNTISEVLNRQHINI